MKKAVFLSIGIALLVSACGGGGESRQDVVGRYEPQFAEMRLKLQAIAQALPASAVEQKASPSLDPAPQYVFYNNPTDSSKIYNTDILMAQHLLDPDLDLGKSDQVDLLLSKYLDTYLRWTGPNNPMSSSAREAEAPKDLAAQLEKALQIAYLGVARVGDYVPAVASDAENFQGGLAEVDGFLFDMESQALLCSFHLSIRVDEQVSYTYKEGEDRTAKLTEAANARLKENVHEQLMAAFAEMCGGQFTMR